MKNSIFVTIIVSKDFIMNSMWQGIIIGWFVFVAVIYLWLVLDMMYYSKNVKNKLHSLKTAITEE